MLTINNNRNNPNFTSTFRLVKPKQYDFGYMNEILEGLRKAVVKNSKFNGMPRFGEYSASPYCSKDVRTVYFDQYLPKKANNGFSGGRDIFFFETERPLKTEYVSGSNPPRREIVHGDKSSYHKVTVSVPDSKDSLIEKFLQQAGIKYTSQKLPDEKNYQYVLINSDNIKKGSLRAVQIVNYVREFTHMEIVKNFLHSIEKPFRILTARASKGERTAKPIYELELRIPKKLIPLLRSGLNEKGLVIKTSSKPKYLNYT